MVDLSRDQHGRVRARLLASSRDDPGRLTPTGSLSAVRGSAPV